MEYMALLRTDDLPAWDGEKEFYFHAPSREAALLAGEIANEVLAHIESDWRVDWLFERGEDGIDTASIPCEDFSDGEWDEC